MLFQVLLLGKMLLVTILYMLIWWTYALISLGYIQDEWPDHWEGIHLALVDIIKHINLHLNQ